MNNHFSTFYCELVFPAPAAPCIRIIHFLPPGMSDDVFAVIAARPPGRRAAPRHLRHAPPTCPRLCPQRALYARGLPPAPTPCPATPCFSWISSCRRREMVMVMPPHAGAPRPGRASGVEEVCRLVPFCRMVIVVMVMACVVLQLAAHACRPSGAVLFCRRRGLLLLLLPHLPNIFTCLEQRMIATLVVGFETFYVRHLHYGLYDG